MVDTQNKYAKGVIYKIMSSHSDCVYIGSTIHLSNRLTHHKYIRQLKDAGRKVKNVRSLEITCHDDWKLEIVEEYPCQTKKELTSRERFWIEQHPTCVNHVIPTRTKKEYHETNEEQKQKSRCRSNIYYQQNKDQIKAKFAEKINCPKCNCQISRTHILRHQGTEKCKTLSVV